VTRWRTLVGEFRLSQPRCHQFAGNSNRRQDRCRWQR